MCCPSSFSVQVSLSFFSCNYVSLDPELVQSWSTHFWRQFFLDQLLEGDSSGRRARTTFRAFFLFQAGLIGAPPGCGKLFLGYSLPNKRDRQPRGLLTGQCLPSPPPRTGPLPINSAPVKSSLTRPPLYLRIRLHLVKLLPPACVFLSISSNETFGLWNPGYFSHLGRCSLLIFVFFLFLRSAALRVYWALPLILLVQSFKAPFHLLSGLGLQTSPDFSQDRVFTSVSFSPSCQG